MNSIIIGQTLEIPLLIIQQLNNNQKTVIVHSIIAKNIQGAQQIYQQLIPNQTFQINGLTFIKNDNIILFVAALDQFENQLVILHLLYVISQYIHFQENELSYFNQLFEQLPIKQIQKYGPKISKKYTQLLNKFFCSKKHLKIGGKPKLIERCRMTGIMLLNLMLDFCEYYNTNKNINNSLYIGVFKREIYRQYEEIRNVYYQQINKISQGKQLFDIEILYQQLQEIQEDIFFKLIECVQCNEIKDTLIEFVQHCRDDQNKLIKHNNEQSEKFCQTIFSSYLNIFNTECQDIDNIVQQKDIYIKQKWASFEEILENYLKDSQGPSKHIINQQITTIIFQHCDQWFEQLNSHYMFELNKCKAQLMQTIENYQELQNRLSDVESKKFELENINQGLYFELESQKRETEKLIRLKELTDELNAKQQNELQTKLTKVKGKNKNYKETIEKLQEDQRKQTYELNENKKQQVNALVKAQHLEKALDQTLQKQQQDSFEKELMALIQQFKDRLDLSSRDSITSRLSSETSSFRVLEKLQNKYDKVKEKSRISEEELNKLRINIEELQKKQQEDEVTISKLNNELLCRLSKEEGEKLIQGQKQKDNDLYLVLTSHKKNIEDMNEQLTQMQNKYYMQSIDYSNLEFLRANTLTVLRETLKLVQKKPNTLITILKSMPKEQQDEIKEILQSSGIKI